MGKLHQIEADTFGLVDSAGSQETRLRWQDVVRIYGEKVDKITYEENYLVIEGARDTISIGELDDNFHVISQEVRTQFVNIPENWMACLEVMGSSKIDLWPELQSK